MVTTPRGKEDVQQEERVPFTLPKIQEFIELAANFEGDDLEQQAREMLFSNTDFEGIRDREQRAQFQAMLEEFVKTINVQVLTLEPGRARSSKLEKILLFEAVEFNAVLRAIVRSDLEGTEKRAPYNGAEEEQAFVSAANAIADFFIMTRDQKEVDSFVEIQLRVLIGQLPKAREAVRRRLEETLRRGSPPIPSELFTE
jgi:hypothetical protein